MHTAKSLKHHIGVNPLRGQQGQCGMFRAIFTLRNARGNQIRVVGFADASRWLPHQGAKERARRVRPAFAY